MTDLTDAPTPAQAPRWITVGSEIIEPERLVLPDSWVGHIPFAFWLVAAARPRRYVELGVHTGNSYCAVAQAVASLETGTECFGVDHWFGDPQAGLYGEDVYADLKAWHDPRYHHFSRLLRMSFEDARVHVEDGSVDILHIDGLHTFDAVRTDFETWQSKLSERSIVLFHDTNVLADDFGVWKYWQEISQRFPTVEFLHSNGLGVAYTGSLPLSDPAVSPDIRAFFAAADDVTALGALRHYFGRLGDAITDRLALKETRRRGEITARDLKHAHHVLGEIDRDRLGVRQDRDHWQERAKVGDKWDRLALYYREALGLDLDEVAEAVRRLYNSGHPAAIGDRQQLQRMLSHLVRQGTLDISVAEQARRILSRLRRRLAAQKAGEQSDTSKSLDPDLARIHESGLFDEAAYALSAKARAEGWDPLEHYLEIGEHLGEAPSALFEPAYYARRHPDVAEAGVGLLRHYAKFGRFEGRHGLSPARRMVIPEVAETQKPRVLLLMHEASRTGAPILGWNLALKLRTTHDVVVFLKKGGELRPSFEGIGCTIIDLPEEPSILREDVLAVATRLAREVRPTYAVTNTAETRAFVPGLVAAGVGVVSLIHEFSVYVRPRHAAYDILAWAHRVVFPARTVASSFIHEYPYLSQRSREILPQGLPLLPKGPEAFFGSEVYSEGVRARLRPPGHENDFLVVGMGRVQFRKGTDLFLMVAAAALQACPDAPLRFVWIGGGLDPTDTHEFPSVLTDQLARTDLDGRFVMLEELEDLGEVYRQADALALTSRLDPMPNTAVEALVNGVPVVCFEHCSGIAELLAADRRTAELVVPYLDVSAMAGRLLALHDDREAGKDPKAGLQEIAVAAFNMDRYVREITRLGQEARSEAEASTRDHAVILADEANFEPAVFLGSTTPPLPRNEALAAYLVRNRVAQAEPGDFPVGLRRPVAGFNPLVYAEDVLSSDLRTVDPLADWVAKGRPEGRWTSPLVALTETAPSIPEGSRILLHGHFHYVDLAEDFLARLNGNSLRCDLLLTTTDEGRATLLRDLLKDYGKGEQEVRVVPNRGRDIGAFLSGLKDVPARGYEIVGHIHGKKSLRLNSEGGDTWRTFLWEHLIGGQTAAGDACVGALLSDPGLGLVFPGDPNLCGWDANRDIAADLARRMGRTAPLPKAFDWPIGTMFWGRSKALEPLFALALDWADYPLEPVPEDGTILHALERLLPFAAEQAGFTYATSYLKDIQR